MSASKPKSTKGHIMAYTIHTTNAAAEFADHLIEAIFDAVAYDQNIVTDHVMPMVRDALAKIDYSRDALAVTNHDDHVDAIDYQIDIDLKDLIWEIERIEAGDVAAIATDNNVEFWLNNRAECSEYEFMAMDNHSDILAAINEVVAMELHARAVSDLDAVVEAVKDLYSKIQVI